jgi:hypothetical protein
MKKMKQKYVLGSILCILLMLASTQVAFLNVVKSDPSLHEGEAYVGDLWITELDVSSELEEVNYVGVGHANATDDYVAWEGGEGDVIANWTVTTETRYHPDYCVMFSLIVYNIDDNNSEMGSDYSVIDYGAGTLPDDSGFLHVHVAFDGDFLKHNTEATLVCYLNAAVKINNTDEAVNFTTWGQDRCVVGVVFDTESTFEPYSHFSDEANNNFPNIWSWLPGWNENNRFDDEQDMLENQTFFYVGGDQSSEQGDWCFGQFDIYMGPGIFYYAHFSIGDIFHQLQFDQQGKQNVYPFISLVYHYSGGPGLSMNRMTFVHEGSDDIFTGTAHYPKDSMGNSTLLHDYDDQNSDGKIPFFATAWSWGILGCSIKQMVRWALIDSGDGELQSSGPPDIGYYWMNSCGYFNTTYSLDVDSEMNFGITTVDCDISNVLLDNEQYVYTYAADVGDTQIQLTC